MMSYIRAHNFIDNRLIFWNVQLDKNNNNCLQHSSECVTARYDRYDLICNKKQLYMSLLPVLRFANSNLKWLF